MQKQAWSRLHRVWPWLWTGEGQRKDNHWSFTVSHIAFEGKGVRNSFRCWGPGNMPSRRSTLTGILEEDPVWEPSGPDVEGRSRKGANGVTNQDTVNGSHGQCSGVSDCPVAPALSPAPSPPRTAGIVCRGFWPYAWRVPWRGAGGRQGCC